MKWKKSKLILMGGFVFLITIWMLFTYTIQMAFDGMCGNKFLSETSSPDRMYRVFIFQRDCGSTTGFSTHVSVLKAGEMLPNRSGNLFIADTDHGKAPSGMGGGPEVRLSWIGSRSVRLIHHKNTRVFLLIHGFWKFLLRTISSISLELTWEVQSGITITVSKT